MSKNVKRILIAEDSTEWQRVHTQLLNSYNKVSLIFDIASNARDALEMVKRNLNNPYDLVLSDLQMESDFSPDFAGEWLIKNIKEFSVYRNVPIVIISATYNIGFVASNLGVDYLSKRSLISNPDSYYFMLDEHLL